MARIRLNLKATVPRRVEATGLLTAPGDAVIIARGRPRWLLIACPCGCGEQYPINLDREAGPAWRPYFSRQYGFSLYPSVWRDSGCGSHFIIWRDEILLFDRYDDGEDLVAYRPEKAALLAEILHAASPSQFVPYEEIADRLGEVPWDVLSGARSLVRQGKLEEGKGKARGTFRRAPR